MRKRNSVVAVETRLGVYSNSPSMLWLQVPCDTLAKSGEVSFVGRHDYFRAIGSLTSGVIITYDHM